MSYAMDYSPIAVQARPNVRASFIRRTYGHLAAAILAFAALEMVLFQVGFADEFMKTLTRQPGLILVVFLGFIGVSWLASWWAQSSTSLGMQYVGLGLYVVLQAIIFLPLLWYAQNIVRDDTLIPTAAILTLSIVAGLTLVVFVTRSDFSFLGPILSIASMLIIGVIIASFFIQGLTLGLGFSFVMVGFASAAILYDTSNVLHHYRTNQHVAASLALFASVALLCFYILRILIALNGRD